MEKTKEAMKLFIRSLPDGSMFEIISFGSRYNALSQGKGFKVTDANIEMAINNIDMFNADMGGTEIFEPLQYSIDWFQEEGMSHFRNP